MEKLVYRLSVQTAQNGFQVYLNDYMEGATVRPVPYVFETMENLLKFVEQQLEKK